MGHEPRSNADVACFGEPLGILELLGVQSAHALNDQHGRPSSSAVRRADVGAHRTVGRFNGVEVVVSREHELRFTAGKEPPEGVATALLRNSGLLEELLELTRTQVQHAEERDRPRFEAHQAAAGRLTSDYQPQWKLRQVSGDQITNLEWRFRGPRFDMGLRAALSSRLADTSLSNTFNIAQARAADELLGEDQMGFEIRFHWHGGWRTEVHRFPLSFQRTGDGRELANVGDEILPPLELDEA